MQLFARPSAGLDIGSDASGHSRDDAEVLGVQVIPTDDGSTITAGSEGCPDGATNCVVHSLAPLAVLVTSGLSETPCISLLLAAPVGEDGGFRRGKAPVNAVLGMMSVPSTLQISKVQKRSLKKTYEKYHDICCSICLL